MAGQPFSMERGVVCCGVPLLQVGTVLTWPVRIRSIWRLTEFRREAQYPVRSARTGWWGNLYIELDFTSALDHDIGKGVQAPVLILCVEGVSPWGDKEGVLF